MTERPTIPANLFTQIAREVVPKLRQSLVEMGIPEGDASPSLALTATVPIDGRDARVRVAVTLDPDDDEDED